MMVWPPAWALLCLGQVGGEGGSPSQAGRMPPAPQEEGGFRALGYNAARPTEVLLELCGLGMKTEDPGPQDPLLLHS